MCRHAFEACATVGYWPHCKTYLYYGGKAVRQSNYAAAGRRLRLQTKSIALESARKGVTVNPISPGLQSNSNGGAAVLTKYWKVLLRTFRWGRLGTARRQSPARGLFDRRRAGFVTGAEPRGQRAPVHGLNANPEKPKSEKKAE